MSIESNIAARNLATEFVDMGVEFAAEQGLVDESFRHFWGCVIEFSVNLVDEKVLCSDCNAEAISRDDKVRTVKETKVSEPVISDEDIFPWGKYKGRTFGDVPDDYFQWFLSQDWCDNWPDIVEYANLI